MLKRIFQTHGIGIFSALLVVAAALLGADSSFAMAVDLVNTATEKIEDDRGLATQMPGIGANTTETVESGFSAEEIEAAIAQFRPFKTPLEYSIVMEAVQRPVEKYEVTHYRTGTTLFDVTTTKAVSSENDGVEEIITLKYGSGNELATKADLRLLTECKCVHAQGVPGYDEKGNTNGCLSLYVLKNDGSEAQLLVLNPPKSGDANSTATIPSGTRLLIGATAGSESQMHVAPDNYEPVPTTVYLSKRICNIVFTDDWLNDKKKVAFGEDDVRQNALYNFQVGNEINDWLGAKSRHKVAVNNAHMNDEFVYTSEGVLRQIKMFYAYEDGKITPYDLNAIAKIDFTQYSENNTAKAYCGKDFIFNLLNMDFTTHKEIKFEDVDVAGMAIKSWKNNFGKIDFVYTPILDLIGFSKYAAVIDIQNAVHYVKRAQKTDTVDMKKGSGENREAKREVFSRIDCVALRGYNAILVGPSSEIASTTGLLPNIDQFATSWNGVSADYTPANGDVVYLTAAFNGFSEGDLIQYNATTQSWSAYNGQITV